MSPTLRTPLPALLLSMALLLGCAHPVPPATASSPSPKPATSEATSSTVRSGDHVAARSFIDARRGWAVGTDADNGSLVLHTMDAGKHWTVQLRDDHDFPLVGVSFVDALHGWAIASTGTLVGYIIATDDGGRSWHQQGAGYGPLTSIHFTDALHGTVRGWDGESPQRPITLTTTDGGEHWRNRRAK